MNIQPLFNKKSIPNRYRVPAETLRTASQKRTNTCLNAHDRICIMGATAHNKDTTEE